MHGGGSLPLVLENGRTQDTAAPSASKGRRKGVLESTRIQQATSTESHPEGGEKGTGGEKLSAEGGTTPKLQSCSSV